MPARRAGRVHPAGLFQWADGSEPGRGRDGFDPRPQRARAGGGESDAPWRARAQDDRADRRVAGRPRPRRSLYRFPRRGFAAGGSPDRAGDHRTCLAGNWTASGDQPLWRNSPRRHQDGDCGRAQRREKLAAQPAAGPRPGDRQSRAGHDPRFHRRTGSGRHALSAAYRYCGAKPYPATAGKTGSGENIGADRRSRSVFARTRRHAIHAGFW